MDSAVVATSAVRLAATAVDRLSGRTASRAASRSGHLGLPCLLLGSSSFDLPKPTGQLRQHRHRDSGLLPEELQEGPPR